MFRIDLLLLLLASVCVHGAVCDGLTKLKIPHSAVERAETVAAGASTQPSRLYQNAWAGSNEVLPADLPAFCRVLLKITPVSDSEISVEVWLPVENWNGRFIAVGNGGSAGQINWRAMSRPLVRGYAVASTDTGHQGAGAVGDLSYAEGHPEKVIDFAYRSVHEMAVAGKLITSAFYGRAPQYSYWNGSSTGGRQGLKAAQMYPRDFDGIVAGAPAFLSGRMVVSKYRVTLAVAAGAAPLSVEKLKRLHAAVVEKCDLDDGVIDGVIGAPSACRFDPGSVVELSAPELAMVRSIYGPLRHPETKAEIYPGYAAGSELKWTFNSLSLREPLRELPTVNKPGFDQPFDLVRDLERIERADSGQLSASSTDLGAFFKRGGKLLMVHGWSDPQITPYQSIQYYGSVLQDLGDVRSSFRLFMVPGMEHSRGGEGVNDFDSLAVMEQWVEHGQAPDRITGRRLVEGKTVYTRPLCPWPQVAKYNGSGDTNEAVHFTCKGSSAPISK